MATLASSTEQDDGEQNDGHGIPSSEAHEQDSETPTSGSTNDSGRGEKTLGASLKPGSQLDPGSLPRDGSDSSRGLVQDGSDDQHKETATRPALTSLQRACRLASAALGDEAQESDSTRPRTRR